MRKMKWVGVVGAGLLALSACSRPEPEQPVTDNSALEMSPDADATPEPLPTAAPTAEATPMANAMADVPAEAPVAPDAQMIDDAAATGMTARVSRDAPATGNEVAPQ